MGLRGPVAMSDEARAARGGRDRRTSRVTDSAKRAWASRAETLERLGLAMIEKAAKVPAVKSRANGTQMHSTLSAGLKLLDAADKIWGRLGRLGGPGKEAGAAPAGRVDQLDAFRNRRPRG